jgi:hypothetical protein
VAIAIHRGDQFWFKKIWLALNKVTNPVVTKLFLGKL